MSAPAPAGADRDALLASGDNMSFYLNCRRSRAGRPAVRLRHRSDLRRTAVHTEGLGPLCDDAGDPRRHRACRCRNQRRGGRISFRPIISARSGGSFRSHSIFIAKGEPMSNTNLVRTPTPARESASLPAECEQSRGRLRLHGRRARHLPWRQLLPDRLGRAWQ